MPQCRGSQAWVRAAGRHQCPPTSVAAGVGAAAGASASALAAIMMVLVKVMFRLQAPPPVPKRQPPRQSGGRRPSPPPRPHHEGAGPTHPGEGDLVYDSMAAEGQGAARQGPILSQG